MKPTRSELLLRIETTVLLLAILLQLAACDPAPENTTSPLDRYNVAWTKLPDGSFFSAPAADEPALLGSDPAVAASKMALRCWAKPPSGYRCLRAATFDAGGFTLQSVNVEERGKLDTFMLPYGAGGDGYGCQSVLRAEEYIERKGMRLVSNQPSYLDDRWSRGYVEKYMASNDVDGPRWFPCFQVLNAILRGSLDTLGTTSITKADMGRPLPEGPRKPAHFTPAKSP